MGVAGTGCGRALIQPKGSMMQRGYVTVAGDDTSVLQLHYRRSGRSSAPKLVLLHQTPSSSQMYEALMTELADDFDMLALDTPGFGESPPLAGEFTVAKVAEVLFQAAQALDFAPAHWFGHHTGAALALQVVSDHPNAASRLAMSGPCLLNETLREALPRKAAPVPLASDGSHLSVLWERMREKDPEASPQIWQREALIAARAADAYPQAYRAVLAVDTAEQLQRLQIPTLCFAGTKDPLYSMLDKACALIARVQRAEIEGARSYLCERQSAQVANLLRRFLRDSND